jgi:hypothetical protein
MGDGILSYIPDDLVAKAQQDMDFALRLLNRETREYAIQEAGLVLAEDELGRLHETLDQIAGMSFQEAVQTLKDVGVRGMA